MTPEKQIILELTGMRIYDIIIIIKTQPPFGEKRSVLTNTTEKKNTTLENKFTMLIGTVFVTKAKSRQWAGLRF